MITRELLPEDKDNYNLLVRHPLQSWKWGDFRAKTGIDVVRIGTFDNKKLLSGFQLTFHQIPLSSYTVGYFPKGEMPNEEMLTALTKIGQQKKAIFIKLEPNVIKSSSNPQSITFNSQLTTHNLQPSPKPLFTKYTFCIDLTKSEEELFKNLHPKTRYNIRLAQKYGVSIKEDNSETAFNKYLELTRETARRQGFYAHNDEYHRQMWQTLSSGGIARLFTASYEGEILVTWILFLYKKVLYYPYGASSVKFKEVMASNLMMWETMRWGKLQGAHTFDLWGTPGPNPQPTDDYYGFHRFKLGYNPKLVEFIGTFDLVLKQPHYTFFNLADKIRWFFLKFKAGFLI